MEEKINMEAEKRYRANNTACPLGTKSGRVCPPCSIVSVANGLDSWNGEGRFPSKSQMPYASFTVHCTRTMSVNFSIFSLQFSEICTGGKLRGPRKWATGRQRRWRFDNFSEYCCRPWCGKTGEFERTHGAPRGPSARTELLRVDDADGGWRWKYVYGRCRCFSRELVRYLPGLT